ncbi:MAG: glycosyltransferase [Bacteroidetes bacterium]|nr:glycosyltransferase [Bacteroidota bacterium]
MESFLFISLMNSDPWGGSEEQWFALAKYCCSINKKVTCLMYDWQDKKNKLKPLAELGANIIYIPNKGRKKENLFQRLRFEWITRLEQKQFIKQFDFRKYDYVLVNQGGFMEVTSSPWKNVYNKFKKYSLTFHNYDKNFVFKPSKAKLLIEWMQNAHLNIGDAFRIGGILENQLQTKIVNWTAVVNPITIERSKTYTSYPELIDGKYKIIMLAQLDITRKAQDNLIRALTNTEWKNRNIVVELYGDGSDVDLLQNLIIQNKLENIVVLKGNTKEVAKALESAHLVLQITHRDAMPISVVEAMSKSRAVIVSDIGDMPLWVEDGVNGWVSPDASIESIKNVLEKAWQRKDTWEKMGKNSFDIFEKKFPVSVEAYFYNKIIV